MRFNDVPRVKITCHVTGSWDVVKVINPVLPIIKWRLVNRDREIADLILLFR